jgi:signal transduction histidine kinase/ActR/RegA family two-component response regulator
LIVVLQELRPCKADRLEFPTEAAMVTLTFRRKTLSWVILGLLVAALFGAAISFEKQVVAQGWVKHTLSVRMTLLRVLSTLQNAETGLRGFLLTGEESFLEPLNRADQKTGEQLEKLGQAISDNREQTQRLDRLHFAATSRTEELEKRLQQRRTMPDAPLSEGLRTGQRLMDEVHSIIAEMLGEEDRLLATRNAETRRSVALTEIGVVGALLFAALLGWATIKDRQNQIEELRTANGALQEALAKVAEESNRREKLEGQLRQAQKMEAVGQLTGGMAHDLNNMLAVIVGALNLVRRKMPHGEAGLKGLIEKALGSVDRAAVLTQRLLAFSRQQPLAPQIVNANKLVADMSEMIRRTLGGGIRVETVLASGLWRTYADAHQLESALLNLAVNARDAMADEGKLTIETANASIDEEYACQHVGVRAGQYVLVAVTDSGTGMPSEVIAKAFDPFFTTKGPGKGTGLGLSQVYGFVKQSGGHIKIYSELGHGTTIKIYLPRFVGRGKVAHPTRQISAAGPIFQGCPETLLLVVDDEEGMRDITAAMLQDLGYSVLSAGSGAEALSLIDDNPRVTLLFTDVVMPDMSGRALAKEALNRRPDLKVIFTTGFTRNAVIHNGILDPGVNFLPKPFSIEQLSNKVTSVLAAIEST